MSDNRKPDITASGLSSPKGDKRQFSNLRTECPRCGARHGFAALITDEDAGKCHACGEFIPPGRREQSSVDRLSSHNAIGRRPQRQAKLAISMTPKKHIASYSYYDEIGALLYVVVRREWYEAYHDGKANRRKDFLQYRIGPNGEQILGLADVRRVIYELPAVLSAVRQGYRIWIVEGEKSADALNDQLRHELGSGEVATTAPGGADGWRSEFAESFRGADVAIWPDADEPGQRLAKRVINDLQEHARSVRLVSPEILMEVIHGL